MALKPLSRLVLALSLLIGACAREPNPAPPVDLLNGQRTWCEVLRLKCPECSCDPGRLPKPTLVWRPSLQHKTQTASGAPELVALLGDAALRFDAASATRVALQDEAVHDILASSTGFTLSLPLRLDSRPPNSAALVSQWRSGGGGRALELAVDRWQVPTLLVSSDGGWGDDAWERRGDIQMQLGRVHVLTLSYRPGEAFEVWLDGHLGLRAHDDTAWALSSRVDTPVTLGNRGTGSKHGLTGALGPIALFERPLEASEILAWVASQGLDLDPRRAFPATTLTSGPDAHWFGYYDKFQTSPDDRYVLSLRSDFENRHPGSEDPVVVGMVDRHDANRWIPLSSTRAWSWQQGAMLQWRPGHESEILFNDRDDAPAPHFVTRILDVETGAVRTLPRATYHVSADGSKAVGLSFARIQNLRVGYGYPGVDDPWIDEPAPEGVTLYTMDLETGETQDVASLAELSAFDGGGELDVPADALQWLNCAQWNPSGTRLLVFHRWRPAAGKLKTRALTMKSDGSDLQLAAESVSHWSWVDDETLLFSGHGGFFSVRYDGTDAQLLVDWPEDGHHSLIADGRYLLSDTYPTNSVLRLHLHDVLTGEVIILAERVHHIAKWSHRVDLHPRISRDGRHVIIDTAHSGTRQLDMIDISSLVDR